MRKILLFSAVLAIIGCESAKVDNELSLTKYVDLNIGTGDNGHVFMGANVPFGFIQLGPSQICEGWDWCSGYHAKDSTIYGFAHQHLNGTGIGDLGDVLLMPVISGKERMETHDKTTAVVRPGYYSVVMDKSQICVELTATKRAGMHRYTYPTANDSIHMLLDLQYGIGWDAMTGSQITMENDSVVTGYRLSTGWAKDQRTYFVAVFDRPIVSIDGDSAISTLHFAPSDNPSLMVRVALSPVSIANAKENLAAEMPDWRFEAVAEAADRAWNDELRKIRIETTDEDAKRIFYTAMFHSMVAPSVFCDVNGDYRGADGVTRKGDFTNYTTFSLWDTYRAAHPLSTLIHSERQADFAKTFINIFKQQGKLPVWHLMGNETDCMVGSPGVIVLADLMLKGYVEEKDYEDAYEALRTSVMLDERGLDMLKTYGYLPYDGDGEPETVARGMEYAIADWCVAKVAERLGKADDAAYFSNRARSYTHYFDPATGFMRGVSKEGKFREPFSPFSTEHRRDDYTEGNGWQYLWLVPHDVHNLVSLLGGDEKFATKLDSLFVVTGDMGADASPDITGLIGQYAHGNEPSHHVAYLYDYVGMPWKTAELVRQIMTTLYHAQPAGLCGNEDVGQMSSWYILSSLGLYQVEPAGGRYVFGSPLFDSATLDVGNGKAFTIKTVNNSPTNIYIQSAMLNGKPYDKSFIMFDDIKAGGTLEFTMGDQPSATFGVAPEVRP